jgi:MFS family permease
MDLAAMIFGLPRAVFPVLAATTFHTDAQGLGYLYAAPGFGAVLAALSSGWLSRSSRLGRVVVVSIVAWGLAIIASGLVPSLWLALVCRNTIQQTLTPDELRGRLTATYFMVVVGGPFIGDFEAGLVAGVSSARVSVVSGGVLSVLGLVVAAVAFPQVWRDRGRATDAPPQLADDAIAGHPV